MKIIQKYFKGLSKEQLIQFTKLEVLYKDWNSKINVISRKDIDELKIITRDILNACINVNRSTISIENKLKEVLK